eukprot:7984175-Lingulodinium_polyedra.AAC.1
MRSLPVQSLKTKGKVQRSNGRNGSLVGEHGANTKDAASAAGVVSSSGRAVDAFSGASRDRRS